MPESIKISTFKANELSLLQQIDKAQNKQIMPNALHKIDQGVSGSGFVPPTLDDMLRTGIKHSDKPYKLPSQEEIRARQLKFLQNRLEDLYRSKPKS
ncbi:MAG: hypothetical protein WCK98_00075 [bacterium]